MSELIDRQALKDAVRRYAGEPIKAKDKKCQAICLDMLGTIDAQPAASPWHRVEEPPKEGTWCVIAKHSYLQPHNLFYDIAHYLHGTFSVYDSGVGDWFDGKPLYWMPIEPPKEDA